MSQAAVKHDTPLPMFIQSVAEADPGDRCRAEG